MTHMDPGTSEVLNEEEQLDEVLNEEADEDAAQVDVGGDGPQG